MAKKENQNLKSCLKYCKPYEPFGINEDKYQEYDRHIKKLRYLNVPELYEPPSLKLKYTYRPFGVAENIIQKHYRQELESYMTECQENMMKKKLGELETMQKEEGQRETRLRPVRDYDIKFEATKQYRYAPFHQQIDAYKREELNHVERMRTHNAFIKVEGGKPQLATELIVKPKVLKVQNAKCGTKIPLWGDSYQWGYICCGQCETCMKNIFGTGAEEEEEDGTNGNETNSQAGSHHSQNGSTTDGNNPGITYERVHILDTQHFLKPIGGGNRCLY